MDCDNSSAQLLTPYDYQETCISAIDKAFEDGYHRPLLVVPTGGGKSLIIALYVLSNLQKYPDFKVIILAHRKELISQNYAEFMEFWLALGGDPEVIGIYSAGLKRKEFRTVMFAGIQSIFRKKEFYGYFNVNIIDEGHLINDRSDGMYGRFFNESLKANPYSKIVGLTATPFKADGWSLVEAKGKKQPLFDVIAHEVTMEELLKANRLAYLITALGDESIAEDIEQLSVNRATGDFDEEESEALMASTELVDRHADTIAKQALWIKEKYGYVKSLVFCVSKAHAQLVNNALNTRFCSSRYLTSDHTDDQRDAILEDFANDQFQMLCNVNILTVGFNQKNINFLAILRPTNSYVLHWQIEGRGSRIHPRKWNEAMGRYECFVLDFGLNTRRLGVIGEMPKVKQKGQERVANKTKSCQNKDCKAENPLVAEKCFACGTDFMKECKSCGGQTFLKNTICHLCNRPAYERKISAKADSSSSIKIKDEYKNVKSVSYSRHISRASNNASFRVSYFVGMLPNHEYWNFDSGPGANFMAQKQWRKAGGLDPAPMTTDEAMKRQNELICPEKILLNTSGKYAQVVDKIYPEPKQFDEHELDVIITKFRMNYGLIAEEDFGAYLLQKYGIDPDSEESSDILDEMSDAAKPLYSYVLDWLRYTKTQFIVRAEREQLLDFVANDANVYLDRHSIGVLLEKKCI